MNPQRTETITVYCTPAEKARILELAGARGRAASVMLRELALDGRIAGPARSADQWWQGMSVWRRIGVWRWLGEGRRRIKGVPDGQLDLVALLEALDRAPGAEETDRTDDDRTGS